MTLTASDLVVWMLLTKACRRLTMILGRKQRMNAADTAMKILVVLVQRTFPIMVEMLDLILDIWDLLLFLVKTESSSLLVD
jgi:hypothetical protein